MNQKDQYINKLESEDLPLNTHEAALLLGYKSTTLKLSRVTGVLGGVQAPAFKKIGRKVVYSRTTLDQWLSQFELKLNTGM